MQYMLLIYIDPQREPARGSAEFDTMMKGYFSANDQMKADGVLVAGESLHGVAAATSLRLKDGKVETMDGPFAETREHLGGFYVVDVPDLDAALRYAALIPSAHFGTIEVRPMMNFNPAGS